MIEDIISYIGWGLFILLGIAVYRVGTRQGWYLNIFKSNDNIVDIPEEMARFNEWWLSEDYVSHYLRKGFYTIVWFFATYLILIMAYVGANVITDNNPMFKIPCLVLIVIMQLICLYKPFIVVAEFLEDFFYRGGSIMFAAYVIDKTPMQVRMSRTKPRQRKQKVVLEKHV